MNVAAGEACGRRVLRRRAYIPVVLTVCLGLGLSAAVFATVRKYERNAVQEQFERTAGHLAQMIERRVTYNLEVLHFIRAFYEGSREVKRDEFAAFLRRVSRDDRSYQALEWIPRVPHAEREAFEQAVQADGFPQFRIHPITDCSEHFPVDFIFPYAGNEKAHGYDLASEPTRRQGLEAARDSGEVAATAPVRLIQETGQQQGFLAFLPVYRNGVPHDTIEERQENLQGFVLGVFRVGDFVESALHGIDAARIHIVLDDISPDSGHTEPLYHYHPKGCTDRMVPDGSHHQPASGGLAGLHWGKMLNVGGRMWSLMCYPAHDYWLSRIACTPYALFAACILITSLIVLHQTSLIRDVTKRKRVEYELRRSEERHRAITETSHDAIIAADADGTLRFWNPAAERIFGFAAAEVIGYNMLDRIVPVQYHEAKRRGMAEFARTGQGPVLGKTLELTALHKDGTEFPIELSLSAFHDGEKHMAVTTIRDITDRQRAEQSLADTLYHQVEMNQMQQDLLAPDLLARKLTKITMAAVRLHAVDFCRIWITKPGDRCESGCMHAKVTEGPHVCNFRDRCLHLMASSGRYTHTDGEVHRRVPFGCYKIGRVASGEERKFLTNEAATDPRVHNHDWVKELGLVSFAGYQLRPPGGETIGVLALFSKHVITPETDAMLESLANTANRVIKSAWAEEEQKSLHGQLAQAQKLESIGQLAAGIAHEINTPTQFVGDNIRFLQDAFADLKTLLVKYTQLHGASRSGSPPPELVAEVDSAVAEADVEYLEEEIPKAIAQSLEGVERVARIVRSMRDFSHPGGQDKVAADLNKAIESTITVARNEWKYVAEMVTDFDASLPPVPCLLGDFNQVILNMIINAAQAVKDVVGDNTGKKGTITVSTRQTGDRAEIRISDTGAGIRKEIRSRIFDPFFTTKEVGKGTGQGLAIAHNVVVKEHGGTIDVESEVGKGTTFIIRLPSGAAAATAPDESASDELVCQMDVDK